MTLPNTYSGSTPYPDGPDDEDQYDDVDVVSEDGEDYGGEESII